MKEGTKSPRHIVKPVPLYIKSVRLSDKALKGSTFRHPWLPNDQPCSLAANYVTPPSIVNPAPMGRLSFWPLLRQRSHELGPRGVAIGETCGRSLLRVIDGVRRYTANLVCKSPITVISLLAHRDRSLTVNAVCKIYISIELLHYHTGLLRILLIGLGGSPEICIGYKDRTLTFLYKYMLLSTAV
jgi:hypothetical protein